MNSPTLVAQPQFQKIAFLNPNMRLTTDAYAKAKANKTMLFALPVILTLGLFELALKNSAILLTNVVIVPLNVGSYLIYRIRLLFSSVHHRPGSPQTSPVPTNTNRPAETHPSTHFPSTTNFPSNRSPSNLNHITPSLTHKPTLSRPEPVREEEPTSGQQFLGADLLAFKAALQNMQEARPGDADIVTFEEVVGENTVHDVLCAIWYNEGNKTICIQEAGAYQQRRKDNLIEVKINNLGKMTEIKINGTICPTVPENLVPRFHAGFTRALEISSHYQTIASQIQIGVVTRGLKTIQAYHLAKLTEKLRANPNVGTKVNFLENNLQQGRGSDAGGLSKEYFELLFKYLTEYPAGPYTRLRYVQNQTTQLLTPITKYRDSKTFLGTPSLEETKMFREMGEVMMYLNLGISRTRLIGKRFENALFQAIFKLTPAEVNTPFDRLSTETKLKLCYALAQARGESKGSLRCIDLARQGMNMNDGEFEEAEAMLFGQLPDDFTFNKEERTHKELIVTTLLKMIYAKQGVGQALPAIHAMAQGMSNILRAQGESGDLQRINPQEFETRVQGSLDRDLIANQIRAEYVGSNWAERQVIQQKTDWIKEWIQEGATEQELRQFLTYVTGVSSVAPGQSITVRALASYQTYVAMATHTCFSQLDVSPTYLTIDTDTERTKEGFIKILKNMIQASANSSGYTMS